MWRKSPAGNFAISSTTCASVFRDGVTNSRKFCTGGKSGRRPLSGVPLARTQLLNPRGSCDLKYAAEKLGHARHYAFVFRGDDAQDLRLLESSKCNLGERSTEERIEPILRLQSVFALFGGLAQVLYRVRDFQPTLLCTSLSYLLLGKVNLGSIMVQNNFDEYLGVAYFVLIFLIL